MLLKRPSRKHSLPYSRQRCSALLCYCTDPSGITRPGIIYLLSFFYLRHEVGFRCGMFASAAPLASTFAGALAYGITSGHSSLSNWRLLFLVEGLPTILLAPVAFFFIPDSPDNARFLSVEEKAIAKSRAIRQTGSSERIGSVNLKQLVQVLFDAKAWCYAVRVTMPCSK